VSGAPRALRLVDGGGVLGAVFAALCCAGTPVIVSGLAALGLSAMRSDAILWPSMLVSLGVALWGFWQGRRLHGRSGPLVTAIVAGLSLAAGVIVVHGFPAMQMIWGGAVVLLVATIWNVRLRATCARPV
jgi:mercuric ion transport protein